MKRALHFCIGLSLLIGASESKAQFMDQGSAHAAPSIRDMILDPASNLAWQIGPFGGGDLNMHHGGFTTTQGSLICCVANSGTGFGIATGIKAFIPVASEWAITPRFAYEGRNGTFDGNPESYKILGQNNSVEDLLLTKQFNAKIATFGGDLLLAWSPGGNSFYIAAGPSIAAIVSQRFTQTEHVASPSGVSYLGGALDQTVLDSDMAITKSLQVLAKIGVGYQIQLSENVSLNPELQYGYPLTKLSKFYDWAGSVFQGTVGILFTP